MGKVAFALALTMFLVACTTTSGNSCAGFGLIRPTKVDIATMSDQLVGQILTHNLTGAKACGWKP